MFDSAVISPFHLIADSGKELFKGDPGQVGQRVAPESPSQRPGKTR